MAKKKLQLLPEVLPDPRPARSVTGGPRTRTLDHLQKLLAASAVAALGCGGSGGSSSGYAVVDPMPMPPPRCFDPNAKVHANATFRTVDGKPVLRLEVGTLSGVTDVKLGALRVGEGESGPKPHVVVQDAALVVAEIPFDPTVGYATATIAIAHCTDVQTAGWLRIAMSWPGGARVDESTRINTVVSAEGLQPWEQPGKPEPEPGDPRFAPPPPK